MLPAALRTATQHNTEWSKANASTRVHGLVFGLRLGSFYQGRYYNMSRVVTEIDANLGVKLAVSQLQNRVQLRECLVSQQHRLSEVLQVGVPAHYARLVLDHPSGVAEEVSTCCL